VPDQNQPHKTGKKPPAKPAGKRNPGTKQATKPVSEPGKKPSAKPGTAPAKPSKPSAKSRRPRRTGPRQHKPDPARDAAVAVIEQHAAKYPDLDPITPNLKPASPDAHQADERDAALARAITDATVKHWTTLSHIVTSYLHGGIAKTHPAAVAALLAGSAQLLLFDRLPAYAILDHAVEYSKRAAGRSSASVVNAVLRRISILSEKAERRDEPWNNQPHAIAIGPERILISDRLKLPDAGPDRLAVACALPRRLAALWTEHLGEERTRQLALHALRYPPTILNIQHVREPLPDVLTIPHSDPHHAVFTAPQSQLRTLLQQRDDLWVQDPASATPLRLAAKQLAEINLQPKLIIDLCAGQGTKTRQLAALFPAATIIATDTNTERRTILAETFANHPRVSVVQPEALEKHARDSAAQLQIAGPSLILLDVPCSNSGVLARRPEARHRISKRALESLAKVQSQILDRAADMLPPPSTHTKAAHAAILYATCSLEPQENQNVVEAAAQRLGLTILKQHTHTPPPPPPPHITAANPSTTANPPQAAAQTGKPDVPPSLPDASASATNSTYTDASYSALLIRK